MASRNVGLLAILMMLFLAPSLAPFIAFTQDDEPLYVMFIWHFHQPWYYDPNNESFILPWVRMHSVGNYYKMAYILQKFPEVKVTFTFSGSLLTQLLDYVNTEKRDHRFELSLKLAEGGELSVEEKFSMLQIPGGFFDINWRRIVDVVPEYARLRDKALSLLREYISLPEEEYKNRVVSEFSDQEILDLACMFNLFWIDPLVLKEEFPSLYKIREAYLSPEGYDCQPSDLKEILEAHLEIMSQIPLIYQELLRKGQVEVIPVPFSHPLAPILTALGLSGDLKVHSALTREIFQKIFNYTPKGVWPAELAINHDVLEVFAVTGYLWTVGDDTVLIKTVPSLTTFTLRDVLYTDNYVWKLTLGDKSFFVFFRNSGLSNLVSFTYSNIDSKEAARDLVSRLKEYAGSRPGGVIVIALDGENPWEHYEEFGDVFLSELYRLLSEAQEEGVIRTITPSEYLALKGEESIPELPKASHLYLALEGKDISDLPHSYTKDAYSELPRETRQASIAEGSWAGGELAIWIGQRQENAAWMLLVKAREDVLQALGATSIEEAMEKSSSAATYLLMAEASDWFWWYGGDGGGTFPSNPLFKGYLSKAYESAGLSPPAMLKALFNPDATPIGVINSDLPKPVASPPTIDGLLGEDAWSSAITLTVGRSVVTEARIGVSGSGLFVGLKPGSEASQGDLIAVYLTNPWRSVSPYHPGYNPTYRDGKLAPMGLFYEILVPIGGSEAVINLADGSGGWVEAFRVDMKYKDYIELYVPWSMLSLSPGDLVYVVIAGYKNGSLIEDSSRLGMTHIIQVPRLVVEAGAKTVFEMKDPVGDDDGAGGYEYPLNPVFREGVFDLTLFRVVDAGDKVRFEVYVRDLGGNPWGGPNGFSLQYVHIYIRTTIDEKGSNETFGLNVALDENSRWHIALLIAPGWGSDPVPQGERAALYYYNGSLIVQDGILDVYADPASNAIIAEVEKTVLLDVDNVDKWTFTVALTSYDGYGPDRIRPFGVEAQEWVVGVGTNLAQAVLFNVVPRVMDLLAPTATDQYEMLNTFKIDRERGVGVPSIIRGVTAFPTTPQPETTTTTITITKTTETSITTTVTTTLEVLERTTETVTSMLTKPGETVTIEKTGWGSVLLVLVVGVVIGALATVLIRRPRV